MLYKSTFEKVRTCYCFAQENASADFTRCVLNNINLVGINMDEQSKKYFIDIENEPRCEHVLEELEYIPHTNFSRLYFKSYITFKN